MQFNFLVFPAPKNYSIETIYENIYLIPRKENNQHVQYCNMNQHIQETDNLEIFIRKNTKTKYSNFHQSWQYKKDHSVHKNENRRNRELSNSLPMIKKTNNRQILKINPQEYIVCTYHPGSLNRIVIFFHANGEDITTSDLFMRVINQQVDIGIITLEYRSYSIYGGVVDSKSIVEDGERIINYLGERGIPISQMVLFGRSIGGSIAFELASKYSINSLILLSPFLSLRKIAEHLYGSCGSFLIKQGLNNQEISRSAQCPILIIHGLQDTLVPYQHSLALMSQCKAYCKLKLIPKMTHSKFSFKHDFVRHLIDFLDQIRY